MSTTLFLYCGAVISMALLPFTVLAQDQPPPVVVVETSRAIAQEVSSSIWVPGTVISRQDSRITAEVGGNLLQIVEVGDRVKRGEVVAQLNDRLLQLQLRNDKASVSRLKSNLAFLSRQVARVKKLALSNNTAESELDRLSMEKEMLAQQVVIAEAARDRSLYNIDRSGVRAPFDGIVVERARQPGEYIERGSVVVRLVNLDKIEVKAQAPISISRYVEDNSLVRVKNDETALTARVRRVVPVGDERSRMLEVRVSLDKGPWVIGEAVRVELANGRSMKALTVPRDALILRDQQVYVYKISPDNNAQRVPVVTGDGAGEFIAVEGDIADGDMVVIRGGERLQDGQAVKVVKSNVATR